MRRFAAVVAVVSARGGGSAWEAALCGDEWCWPRVWVLGAAKSATTSLVSTLESLDFCLASVAGINAGQPAWMAKETHVWHRVADGDVPLAKLAGILTELYPARRRCNRGFVEGTPTNLMTRAVPRLVAHLVPRVDVLRFVAVLREPVARDVSAYDHQRRRHYAWVKACPASAFPTYDAYAACELDILKNSTVDADDRGDRRAGLWAGLYAPQLEAWTAATNRRQIFVLAFDVLLRRSDAAMTALLAFLDVPDRRPRLAHRNIGSSSSSSAASPPPLPRLSCRTRDRLDAIFIPANDWLYAMLARDQAQGRAPGEELAFPRFRRAACVATTSPHPPPPRRYAAPPPRNKTKHKHKHRHVHRRRSGPSLVLRGAQAG